MSHYFVIELEWIFQTKKYDDDFELILSMHTLEKYNKWAVPDMGQPPAVQQVEIGLTEPQKNQDLRITITQPQQLITLTVSLNQIGISREIDLQCSPNSFIQELKNMIYEKLGQDIFEPCRWSLVFNDTVCQENMYLFNYKIVDKSKLKTHYREIISPYPPQIQIFVQADKIITLNCNQNDTIRHIKALFYQKEGYYCRTLITEGQCLQNNHQLSDYSIQNEQTLQMVYTLKGGEGPPNNFQTLNIFIRLKDNHKIGVQVSNDCKIANIKTCIQNDYGISFKKMQLTFNGVNLQDGKDISDYQIFQNATLNIIDPNNFVNDQNLDTVIISLIINKNQYIIPLDKSTTVKSFKKLVSTLEKNDKILSDSSTIVICNGQLVSSDSMTFKNSGKEAQQFSGIQGIIFEIDLISAKDIEQQSIWSQEQEIVLSPYSNFEVLQVVKQNQPIIDKLKEIPFPKYQKVLLWVDDQPENNFRYAQEIEQQQDISIVFCISTQDALKIINQFKWMIFLQASHFRVVTDMVRLENGLTNYFAGIDLLKNLFVEQKYQNEVLVFCENVEKAQENFNIQNIKGNYKITNREDQLKQFIRFQ